MNSPTKLEAYMASLDELTNEALIDAFNQEAGVNSHLGWGSSRASYLAALHRQFDKRKLNYSAIGNEVSLSFKNNVRLEGRKVVMERS